MAQATIFEIKRFGVHDGPGVRTVFFLKGCPLRCRWCHNPEGIQIAPQLAYYQHKCLNCGECIPSCPQKAHSLTGNRHAFDRGQCTACGRCAEVCLGRALRLYGVHLSAEEACKIACEDREFYRENGGVTLSGGEPLLQVEFCTELFSLMRREGIHTALDTCGAVGWERFEQVLPATDLFLYDLKHVDDAVHRQYTGGSNRIILDNLRRLANRGAAVEVRVPVIPGFNDTPEAIEEIGRLLAGLRSIPAVRLLPYHPACSKYESLGLDCKMPDRDMPSGTVAGLADRLRGFPSLKIRGLQR